MTRFSSLICPVCSQPLVTENRSARCVAGHSFDMAREGYFNLLLAHQKRSADPGDNREMMQARRDFLQAGYYDFMWQGIANVIQGRGHGVVGRALDLGCGEGYYSRQLKIALRDHYPGWTGVDISRAGIRMAAKQDAANDFIVASTFNLPLASASYALAVQIFAPASVDEVRRVLVEGGFYVVVNPAGKHLQGLKSLIYDVPRSHQTGVLQHEGFELVHEAELSTEVTLQGDELLKLFMMTPFFWNVGPERQEALKRLASVDTPLDFHLAFYRAIMPSSPAA